MKLQATKAEVEPIAYQDRFWHCLVEGVAVFFERTLAGILGLFTDPDPLEVGALFIRPIQQISRTLDALAALDAATTCDSRILRAREALSTLNDSIDYIENGQLVRSLEKEVTSKRDTLNARLSELLADPDRYNIDEALVLAAIDGEDVNSLFLSKTTSLKPIY